uniref:Uncharacterized protein n=1 Tax=Candidatus Kentrum sp. MB TaxID=2138164 RepID=A0A451BGT0_9GAMM|nr:MAG: hypothetical protein BECKMB1821G_GA0114241_11404 [Candidatus Kentron sp. MB]VFK35866.1 MAG: hypothetical protein BECKMB1821I_GA0114274_11552 [Candidatus Kentron sp. MB]VFK77504.1 MAG: hypothetical protein BECKMB1821H_GA0114242_11502 [Candidatus Kentron sp. MB]
MPTPADTQGKAGLKADRALNAKNETLNALVDDMKRPRLQLSQQSPPENRKTNILVIFQIDTALKRHFTFA